AFMALVFTLLVVAFCATESVLAASASGPQVLTIALRTEPPTLDQTKATDSESFHLLGHLMEGLVRYDKNNKLVPAVAESWKMTDKGVTFQLRRNAVWSDGKPVTAKDFVFAWKTTLDPKTASTYSFILYPIKNAEKINRGELGLEQLGARAVDDKTLEVTFERPCGYFLSLTAFATYFPLREEFYKAQGGKYAANPQNMLFNGPFRLVSWVHGANLRMEKNQNYWNKEIVSLDVIDVPYITEDDSTRFNLFKNKKIDFLSLNRENIINAQREKFKLIKFAEGTFFYMELNQRPGRATANLKLRRAIQLATNASEYVSRVVGIPGTLPGVGLIPSWMSGLKGTFRKENPISAVKTNIPEAKKLAAEAMKELGKTSLSLTWLSTDSPLAVKESEYFQSLFKTALGIDLKIDRQIFKQRLAKQRAGDFDIVSAGWGPDYNDPMTYADLLASWNENNHGKFTNPKYDELIRKAMGTVDQKVRMSAMAEAERIVLEQHPIIPLYERTIMYTHSEKISGVVRRVAGFDPDFTYVRLSDIPVQTK
ncbi:MAG: peptide ABC transporter substrate-binding protein, partial [Bdellovibrionales bacterium]|nr:peptide ABC transporter substrate-binding protein [Bdellovibrionales bacterium]